MQSGRHLASLQGVFIFKFSCFDKLNMTKNAVTLSLSKG